MSVATEPTSPREVFHRLLQGIASGHWEELADLYAADAVVEVPFALPSPLRLEGREQIRAHFLAATGQPLELRPVNVVVRETDDPEVVVAEFDYEGRVTTGSTTFRAANVQTLRVRDGLIVSSRDYHDHVAIARALGAFPEAG
ncbi:nuclear transport factor 2 family protein [Allostreptomyces psammosilenae]|uniref:Ketosteroid isomerase-like protein n=1 Tax=Allostreptomyces psammosilenae TaxID=1892865 RepID=A0A853A151_9ACTN|nr:nuclear transport factor 2 family protein [Allostreptomyces psammosilenae]NYI04541.1 ketosteroid isomerase-like protein [Allostreptomyces psammosilenae]